MNSTYFQLLMSNKLLILTDNTPIISNFIFLQPTPEDNIVENTQEETDKATEEAAHKTKESSEDADEEEEDDEDDEDDDDEEEEGEDQFDALKKECAELPSIKPYVHHYEECVERVTKEQEEPGYEDKHYKEDCVEEFFHLQHALNDCAAPKLFFKLK
jgi:ubiquinol-cytochrome c reductase subunit 6